MERNLYDWHEADGHCGVYPVYASEPEYDFGDDIITLPSACPELAQAVAEWLTNGK